MHLEIRTGTQQDLAGILDVYNHYVRASPSTFDLVPVDVPERSAWFEEHTRAGPHRLLVASTETGAVLGWATTSPFRSRPAYATTVESSVYCDPSVAGRGIGSRLYASLFDSIQHEDVERIVAGVVLPNPASVALHRRFGFAWVGTFTHVGRKFGRYWDVAWFERPRSLPSAGSGEVGRGRARGGSSGRAAEDPAFSQKPK